MTMNMGDQPPDHDTLHRMVLPVGVNMFPLIPHTAHTNTPLKLFTESGQSAVIGGTSEKSCPKDWAFSTLSDIMAIIVTYSVVKVSCKWPSGCPISPILTWYIVLHDVLCIHIHLKANVEIEHCYQLLDSLIFTSFHGNALRIAKSRVNFLW